MKCPKCQHENPESTKFCGECGTQLIPPSEAQPSFTKTIETPPEEITRGTQFAGRYEIIEELGAGGMGRVYRVEDKKLKQEVALKLIKPEIAKDKKTVERFQNELKSARMISHKNVCRMFDMGESGEAHFITMEYVKGEDLRSMIRMTGQLGIGTAINVAKQICEGLSEAHHLGVIHRDLKSSNIMIDKSGRARIMDFGIARSLKGKGITGAGVMIGTPEYMSPEQVEGKDTDQRSDIYSLGIILYEMLTGSVPFEGDTPFTVGVKQKSEAPKDPRGINPQIPEDLGRVILKCLSKEKESRYQSADEVKAELERIEEGLPTTVKTVPARKPLTSREITVSLSIKNWIVPVVVIAVLFGVSFGIWQLFLKKDKIAEKPSIAVLPFTDRNPHGDSADLCRETSVGIYDKLKQLGKFDVRSRFIVDAHDMTNKDPLTIGRELEVSNVIVGDLRTDGEKFSVEVELLNVANGSTIWHDNIPGDFRDIMSVPGDVAEKVTTGLDLKLSPEERGMLQKRLTENSEAFRYYSLGRRYFAKRAVENMKEAIKYFNHAIELDPEFAHAYSGLADAYLLLDGEKAREAAIKALRLDNTLAEAHTSLGGVRLENDWDWEGAEKEFKTAIDLDPNYANAHHWYGRLLTILGRHDEAIEEMECARELDPLDVSINRNLGATYLYAGQTDRAIEQLQEALRMDPDFPQTKDVLDIAYFLQSKFQEILELHDYDEENPSVQYVRLLELAKQDKEKAVAIFNELSGSLDGVTAAFGYALLGERNKVFEELERAYEDRYYGLAFVKVFPGFSEYHSDPRFQALLKKMRLD